MMRFASQIEFRMDQRHLILFFLGGIVWTLVAFFFGMLVASDSHYSPEKGLSSVGWLRDVQEFNDSRGKRDLYLRSNIRETRGMKTNEERAKDISSVAWKTNRESAAKDEFVDQVFSKNVKNRSSPRERKKKLESLKRFFSKKRSSSNDKSADKKRRKHLKDPLTKNMKAPSTTEMIAEETKQETKKVFVEEEGGMYTILLKIPEEGKRVIQLYTYLAKQGFRPILVTIPSQGGVRTYRMTLGRFIRLRDAKAYLFKFINKTKVLGSLVRLKDHSS